MTAGALEGRVLGVVAGTYRVEADGEILACSLRGRLRRGADRVVAGDRVRVERLADGSGRLTELLPRRSVLARRGPRDRRPRPIAANLDQVAAVVSLARPDPDFRHLDRILVLAELDGLAALVVANKVDLVPADPPPEFEAYERAGYPVVRASARTGEGVDALRARLAGRTTAFAGVSGVGKSSLANRLIPGAELQVADVGGCGGRGRHTTVAAALLPIGGGGYLADTPGFTFAGMEGVGPERLAAAFPELRRAGPCRFADCRHRVEPGCAVRAAALDGGFPPSRYESYVALLDEAGGG